ncbi:hypothetical protein [Actinomadura madurae]|uniref:hypothetical protein n=1 Tax=Actinomadura madurae TaxID=1993 RepID=UPI0020D2291B|nr:hypothetical protein [Actinomadura madurae]MCQ0004006.1 hypothetical protein [Actinomadura madurae]
MGLVALPLRDRDLPGGLGADVGEPPLDAGDAQLGHQRPGEPVGEALQPVDHLPRPGDLAGESWRLQAALAAGQRGLLARAVPVLAVADGAGAAHRLRHGPSAAGARPDRDRVTEACDPGAVVFGGWRLPRAGPGGRVGRRVGLPRGRAGGVRRGLEQRRGVGGRPRRVRSLDLAAGGRGVALGVGGRVGDDGKVGLRRGGGGRGDVVDRGDLLVFHVPWYARTPGGVRRFRERLATRSPRWAQPACSRR